MFNPLTELLKAFIDPPAQSPQVSSAPSISGASTAGMVQCGSLTFSIWRLSPNHYGVVRLIDDAYLGTFHAAPQIQAFPMPGVDKELLLRVARTAKRLARTTAIRRR